ncbi:MAG: hypothetical protein P8Y54_02955 [Xanthomonadales bacterium]
MPETPLDDTLQRLLAYPPEASGESERFVVGVMKRVQRERRRRRIVLATCGSVGALFGLAGASLLAGPVENLFTDVLTPERLMQAALLVAAAAAFHTWLMGDDLPLRG